MRDSTEVNFLKSKLSERENEIILLKSEKRLSEQQFKDIVERLEISENEKQQLHETYESTVKEYDAEGRLIKETYSKKTSELTKEINFFKEENKQLKDELYHTQEMNIVLQNERDKAIDQFVEAGKKVVLLEKELEARSVKHEGRSYWWVWMVVGGLGGALVNRFVRNLINKFAGKLFALIK